MPEAPVTEAAPSSDRDAQQAYLEGVIYFQKGDYEMARARWLKSRDLAPRGSDSARDAQAGLEKIDAILGKKAPASLKEAPEKKDEHLALETYFTGLIHYQKGDLDRARVEWKRALSLAPKGSSVESDAKAALEKLDKDEASTRDGRNK
jgi:Flp pilus assembly protein TadD